MITLNDCKAFCDADPATVARVARREQLPEIVAIARVQSSLMKARPLHARHPITFATAPACVPQRLAA
jgi:hypothetical protein